MSEPSVPPRSDHTDEPLTEAAVPETPTETPQTESGTAPEPTRRERRAKAGVPAAKVHGPQGAQRHAAPAKGRDYAHRRRG